MPQKPKLYSEADMGDMSHYDPSFGMGKSQPKAHAAKVKAGGNPKKVKAKRYK